MDRLIFHIDVNSAFLSWSAVKRLEEDSNAVDLRTIPSAVGGDVKTRHGVITAKSIPAKKFGIKTGEPVMTALRKCPDLVLLPPHHEKYRRFSRLLNQIYQEYTDMVEPFSIDESWLDVTASQRLFGTGREIADPIRGRVRRELGITLSAGVSYNKIFAKMGSEYRKPDATTVITRDNYQKLLWPKPVGQMFFVGFSTAQRLVSAGIRTIGDLANADPSTLASLLGKQGPVLRTYARGEDQSPVRLFSQRDRIKSVGNGFTYSRNLVGEDDIRTALTALSDTVASRLRSYGLMAWGVKVDIKDPSLKTISRQKQLDAPVDLTSDIRQAALDLIHHSWKKDAPIRLLTVTAINLVDEATAASEGEQLSLFGMLGVDGRNENGKGESNTPGGSSANWPATMLSAANDAATERSSTADHDTVERTMDQIRAKFGNSAIRYGGIIGNDIGIDL